MKGAAFFQGTGPIWLDDVNCFGNETSFDQCPHAGFRQSNCQHNEDAGVICQGINNNNNNNNNNSNHIITMMMIIIIIMIMIMIMIIMIIIVII